jgi:hypothetical protein
MKEPKRDTFKGKDKRVLLKGKISMPKNDIFGPTDGDIHTRPFTIKGTLRAATAAEKAFADDICTPFKPIEGKLCF